MAKKLKIGVIFGGRSGEHEISIRSAKNVIENLDKKKYDIVPVAINKDGAWLSSAESLALLPETAQKAIGEKNTNSDAVGFFGDPRRKGLSAIDDAQKTYQIDVMFPVLHGTFGEDGTIQGLFEMAGIPYVGCGVLASSCGMDKVTMKTLFHEAGLPMCRYIWFLRREFEKDPKRFLDKAQQTLGFPVFVKPANLGSSVGVSKATDKKSLQKAIELAAKYDRRIVVEEGVDAREIECAVLGNDEPKASLPGEYVVFDEAKKFLDYTEKYSGTGNNDFIVPAKITPAMQAQIQGMAIRAFKAVDGAGLARVDFFLRRDTNEILINEINTLPGMTDSSGYPKMWKASGKELSQVFSDLIDLALERHQDKAKNQTTL